MTHTSSTEDEAPGQAFRQALPWYINGTLDAAGRVRVEQYLRDHPGAAAELDWHAELRQTVRSELAAIPAELGWDEYARHAGLQAAPPAPSAPERSLRALVARRWATLQAWTGRPAFALGAVALVLLQLGVIGSLLLERDRDAQGYVTLRSTGPGTGTAEPLLRVRFKRGVTEQDLRKLLLSVDARLVDGPSQLGDYFVSVPPDRLDAVRKALSASALVAAAGEVNPPAGR